ncbi:Uncharacterized protein SCF082_LOCUS30351 [Durusdinium trenchii]|uniref:Uncharacterized protein n=1 Tax=Durusdinium trenchii TaxID=1381693 RepID=A0ABP0MY99_9DINO
MADVEDSIAKARTLEAAGSTTEAVQEYLKLLKTSTDALSKGTAALCLGNLAMAEQKPDNLMREDVPDILQKAFDEAHALPVRSRMLEGRLLQQLSELLLSGVKDADAVDRGVAARRQARQLLLEGAVEYLDWSLSKAEKFLAEAKAETTPLPLPQLMERLGKCGVRVTDAETIEELFDAWALPTAGGMALSIQDFLKNYLDLAKGISPEPCHAPCEGLSGSSSLAQELRERFPESEPELLQDET